ncbi:MAG: phytanoyl-CoA dioxygenase family protein [bacterium]
MPRSATKVKWHQDFPFDPHTNDDCFTVMLYLDRVTSENGAPKIIPDSHRGPIHSLWHDGVFTGSVCDKIALECEQSASEYIGDAGSLCLMHTLALLGSSPNLSTASRTIFIANLTCADAAPLAPNAVPSIHSGRVLCGSDSGRIRTQPLELEVPAVPPGASFLISNQRSSSHREPTRHTSSLS